MALCSTPESLQAALGTLSGRSHVFLDCEGQTLGAVGGKLSLLSMGVVLDRDGERCLSTFLIDALAFQGSNWRHLAPIFDILRSESVFKVMFDGRMDASELLHGHGVQLRNVLDLQVADIFSREKRGESVEKRLGRLVGFLPEDEIRRNRAHYLQVQKLNGLESALEEYGVLSDGKGCELGPIYCDSFVERLVDVDHSRWLRRPLEKSALRYAAADIHKICLLYETFVKSGYITPDSLVRQSALYIALHAKGRPNGIDKYNRHSLLPLALLTEPQAVPVVQCRGCRRNLPVSAFAQSESIVGTNVACFVCKALDTKGTLGGHARFFHAHIYEDLDYDDGFDDILDYDEGFDDTPDYDEGFDDILDYDEGFDDIRDESFYDGDY
jgi:exonuclease 3'-5' domain-containing protein 1